MVSTRPFDRIDQAMHSERVAGNDRIDAADSLLDMARGKENYSPNARLPLSTAVQHKELVQHPFRPSRPDQLPISSPSFPPKLDPRWMYPNGQYTMCAPINREITPSALFSGLHPATTLPPRVPVICPGINDPRIDEYARACPKVRAFLYQKYSYFKKEWRSEDCDYFSASTTEARENKGWKSIKNDLHCAKCHAVKRNLYRLIERLGTLKNESAMISQNIMPSTSALKDDLSESFSAMVRQVGNNKQSRDKFRQDGRVREKMLVLAERGDADVTITADFEKENTPLIYRLYVCKDASCNCILLKWKRNDNTEFCKTCRLTTMHKNASVVGKDNEYKRQVAANSKTPISVLPPKMQTERMENKAKATRLKDQKICTLQKQLHRAKEKLTNSKMCMDGSQGTAFLESSIAAEKPKSASSEETRDDHARDTTTMEFSATTCSPFALTYPRIRNHLPSLHVKLSSKF